MKKLLFTMLLLGMVSVSAQAKQMNVPRLFADVDAACSYTIMTDNSLETVLSCFRAEFTKQSNYLPGWSRLVSADIKTSLAEPDSSFKTMYGQEEVNAAVVFIDSMNSFFSQTMNYFSQYPQYKKVISKSELQEKFGIK